MMGPETVRPSLRWYHSLYWRVALALIALVALMLLAEGALFLWLSDRTAGAMPGRDPRQTARLIAADFGSAFEANASLDIERYLREQYGHFFQTFLILMRDGRVAANHDDAATEVVDAVRAASAQRPFPPRRRGRAPGRGAEPFGRGSEPPGRDDPRTGAQALRRARALRVELAPIVVDSTVVGRVAVLPGSPPFSRIVRIVGPTIGLVIGGVLIVGGAVIALVVFGPARRRLQQVQAATERLGTGDLTARAPGDGGDEIAALARSFNRMADELAERAQALESSDKARRQLLADVSHELMTPLTAMRGYIETLGMPELQLDAPTRERYMRIVTEETHRLEHIIGDLLDLARLEGGGTTMRRERVPIPALFGRVAERHERELTMRGIALVQEVSPGGERVTGDPDRLEQALQNLVANALRYTPDGGRITIASAPGDGAVRLMVRDTGPGIPEEHLASIFDRFYKADASRKAAGGSGLGLSIVRAIVERHGGAISARNENGAVFTMTMPQ